MGRSTLERVLLLLSALVFALAWARLAWVAGTNPSPARAVKFVRSDGSEAELLPHCWGPAIGQGPVIWRVCEYAESSPPLHGYEPIGLIRFDLSRRLAEMYWPFPRHAGRPLRAWAASAGGDIATVTTPLGTSPVPTVHLLKVRGGIETLPPPAPGGHIVGLSWVGDSLQAVLRSGVGAARFTYRPGEGWESTPILLPEPDPATTTRLEAAFWLPEGCQYLFSRVPRATHAGPLTVTLLVGTDSVRPAPALSLEVVLDERGAEAAAAGLLEIPFDRSVGNVTNLFSRDSTVPLLWNGETWVPLGLPAGIEVDAVDVQADYVVENAQLGWIPRLWLYDPTRVSIVSPAARLVSLRGRWLAVRRSERGAVLTEVGIGSGHPLTNNAWIHDLAVIMPATQGGYWILGAHGTHVRADGALDRADPLDPLERIVEVFRRFRRLAPYDDFYLQLAPLKMAALPIVLLFLPFGLLVLAIVDRAKRHKVGRSAPRSTFLVVTLPYLVLSASLGWWFWRLTAAL